MTEPIFDHDRLDVYRLAIEYTADSFPIAKDLAGLHRHARDQWLRASQSIPLNIAEGNGKRSSKDRARFFDIARGSSFECAAIQDVLVASGGMENAASIALKRKLKRIVAMLTRMAMKLAGASESSVGNKVAIEDVDEHEHEDEDEDEDVEEHEHEDEDVEEHEHEDEHEHEHEDEREHEDRDEDEWGAGPEIG